MSIFLPPTLPKLRFSVFKGRGFPHGARFYPVRRGTAVRHAIIVPNQIAVGAHGGARVYTVATRWIRAVR